MAEIRVEPLADLAGPYEGKPLRMPAQVAVTENGACLIADAGNNRIVILKPDRSLLRALSLDPDSLAEPWGVAALPGGQIAVADTWNGRLLSFDDGGGLVSAWGEPEIGGSPPPDRLYGPRSVIHHPATGGLLMADTGHHRIVIVKPDGSSEAMGGPGVIEGRFMEPVGIAIDPRDDSVLVADTWNRRIQRFDMDLSFREQWPVPGWEGRGVFNKPFLAVDGRGFVYATDPEHSRILVFGADGEVKGAMVGAGWRGEPVARPLGIAVDSTRRVLLVADAALARIWLLPTWDPEFSGDYDPP